MVSKTVALADDGIDDETENPTNVVTFLIEKVINGALDGHWEEDVIGIIYVRQIGFIENIVDRGVPIILGSIESISC